MRVDAILRELCEILAIVAIQVLTAKTAKISAEDAKRTLAGDSTREPD